MTDDENLIERVRPLLARKRGISEKRMFGGAAFLVNGNMCVGTWKGSLVVRLRKDRHEETLAQPHVRPFDMTGRILRGWAVVEPQGIESDESLKGWVDQAAKFARSLPPKAPGGKSRKRRAPVVWGGPSAR